MARILAFVIAAFFLYWVLKGTLRRFLAPPRERRRMRRDESVTTTVPEKRRNPGIDYSKVKDADYRDIR